MVRGKPNKIGGNGKFQKNGVGKKKMKKIGAKKTSDTQDIVRASTSNGEVAKQEDKKEVTRSSGFIFMCNGATKPECYRHRVFGLPIGKSKVVQNIVKGAKLFLFDTELKLLYGIYKAVDNGGKDLEPRAFGGRFPAQVRFTIFKDCMPLPESVFKHAIEDNYEGKFKFKPDLNSKQVRKLFSLFQPVAGEHSPVRNQEVHYVPAPAPPHTRTRGPHDHYGALVPPQPPVEVRHIPAPPGDGYYLSEAPPVIEPRRHPAAAVSLPAADPYPYYRQPILSENPPISEHDVHRRSYVTVPEVLPRERLEVMGHRQMLPAREGEMIPLRSDRLGDYYSLRSARRDDNDYEEVSRAGYVRHGYDDPSQSVYRRTVYDDPHQPYADAYSRRRASGAANVSSVPVSSLYSFADALSPSYRAI